MIWETLTNRFAVSTSIQKDANSWDFFELNFSPTIYPPIICLKRLFSATCQKKEIPDNVWLSGICLIFSFVFSDPPGARTQDPNIKSVVLYLLSYWINPYLLSFECGCKGRTFFYNSKRFQTFFLSLCHYQQYTLLIYGCWR